MAKSAKSGDKLYVINFIQSIGSKKKIGCTIANKNLFRLTKYHFLKGIKKMSRTPEVQTEIQGHIDRINYQFESNPQKNNYGQIPAQYKQQWFDYFTHKYDECLPLISYMKQNNTKPQLIGGEWDACQKEIYLELIGNGYPLDMDLANKVLNTIFK